MAKLQLFQYSPSDKPRNRTYEWVLVFEERRQRFDARFQRRVLWLHLATESRHYGHGGVQSVLVHLRAMLSDECQHVVESARLKHGARLTRADELKNLCVQSECHSQTAGCKHVSTQTCASYSACMQLPQICNDIESYG